MGYVEREQHEAITVQPVALGLGVFAFTFCMDLFYVQYLRAVATERPARAATFSVLTHLNGVVNISAVLHDRRYLAAILLGAWMGTYFTVWWSHRHTAR